MPLRINTSDSLRKNQRLMETLVFFLRLIILAAPLYFMIHFADLYFLQSLTASSSLWIFMGFGFEAAQNGPEMVVDGFQFFISKDSTAWKSILFLFALIFAIPNVPNKKRLLGLVIGIPVIWFANLGRIIGIVLVEKAYDLETAMFTHDILWRFGLIGVVLGFWLFWNFKVRTW